MLNIKTYRARSLSAALRLIQLDLGPEATVLSTRQKPDGLLGRLVGSQLVEVTASVVVAMAAMGRASASATPRLALIIRFSPLRGTLGAFHSQ